MWGEFKAFLTKTNALALAIGKEFQRRTRVSVSE